MYLFFSLLNFIIYLFIYLWLCRVFVSVRGLPLVAASGGHSSSRCAGLSLSRPLLLRSTGSRHADSATVAHGPSCSATCGILPDQGSNPCPLHWQADSQPLCHQGSLLKCIFLKPVFVSTLAQNPSWLPLLTREHHFLSVRATVLYNWAALPGVSRTDGVHPGFESMWVFSKMWAWRRRQKEKRTLS